MKGKCPICMWQGQITYVDDVWGHLERIHGIAPLPETVDMIVHKVYGGMVR